MVDPVMTLNGQTYERAYIAEWFKSHATDPLTNTAVVKHLSPNRALKEAIDAFKEQCSSLQITEQSARDKELAMQLWMADQEAAHTRKGEAVQQLQASVHQIQESVQQLELSLEGFGGRLADCESSLIGTIPDDLVRRIADLEGVRGAVARAEEEVLREKQDIVEVHELLEYYVAVQAHLNGLLLACGVVSSEMVANDQRGVAGKVAAGMDFAGQHLVSSVPGASLALSAVSALLAAYDASTQRKRVDKVVSIFRNDAVLISQVTELVARAMTQFHREDLVGVGKVSGKTSSATFRERVKNVLKRCKASAVQSASKEMAQKHVESIIEAIMDGSIIVPYGDAHTTFSAIFSHITV